MAEEEPSPAKALYGSPEEVNGHRKTLEKALQIGLQSLGFGGGAMGIIQEIVGTFDHDRLLSPMRRINEMRQSPEYKGRKPSGSTKEETERLRAERAEEMRHTLLNSD